MAWKIVRRESYHEPGGRSRLWLRNDILHVLAENTGSEVIEGIVLRLSEFEEAHCNPEAFTKMCKLRLLDIHNVSLSKGPKYLPNALRELKWSWYPSKCLPPTFQPDELTELSLRHSKIDHLWDGIKRLGKLKSIDLSYSHNLTRTPDFTCIQNLEELVLEGCTNLAKIHSSIAFLRRLRILNLKDCKSIMSLPNKVEMESLEVFDISGCSKVKKIPEFVGEMKIFSKLSLRRTGVREIPSSVIRSSLEGIDLSGIALRETESSLVSVKIFELSNFLGCNAPPARSWRSFITFGEFPTKISHPVSLVLASLKDLCFLKQLNLENCNLCEGAIPDDIGFLSSLERLNLSGNHFVSRPASISGLSKLKYFGLENCKRLQQLPTLLPLNSELDIWTANCTSLKVLPYLPHACRLRNFWLSSVNCFSLAGNQGCNAIKRIIQGLPHCVEYVNIVIPGSEIPEWFNNQSIGHSVIEKLPSHSCNSKVVGFALCALFVPAQNISAPTCEGWFLGHRKHKLHDIACYPQFGSNNTFPESGWGTGYGVSLTEIASDHLCLVFRSRKYLKGCQPETNRWDQIQFRFETYCDFRRNTCLKVKKCGVRTVYEQDREEELNLTMKQYSNRSISLCEDITNCDFDESKTVQRDVIKQTREQYSNEAGPSGSGSSSKRVKDQVEEA